MTLITAPFWGPWVLLGHGISKSQEMIETVSGYSDWKNNRLLTTREKYAQARNIFDTVQNSAYPGNRLITPDTALAYTAALLAQIGAAFVIPAVLPMLPYSLTVSACFALATLGAKAILNQKAKAQLSVQEVERLEQILKQENESIDEFLKKDALVSSFDLASAKEKVRQVTQEDWLPVAQSTVLYAMDSYLDTLTIINPSNSNAIAVSPSKSAEREKP